jgi:2-polyprenyl-3-methyl-5-hydroxy-6-metoxy-1,4-benzoquinol methylase
MQPAGAPRMTAGTLSPLDDRPDLLPGNLGKVRVICELGRRLQERPGPLRVLDVGCVGPQPFNQWDYLFTRYPDRIRLTAVDVRGLERARAVARERGYEVELLEASAYELWERLGQTYEVVVATQVLEHLRHPAVFFSQLARVLVPGGQAFLTLDSGHFEERRSPHEWLRDVLAPVLPERYHDRGLATEEVARLAEGASLRVDELRPCNLAPLKPLHNHGVSPAHRGTFLRAWHVLEESLLGDATFVAAHRDAFRGLYARLSRPT